MLISDGHKVSVFVNDSSVKNTITEIIEGVRLIRFNPNQTGASSHLGHVTNISYEFAAIVQSFIAQEGAPDIIEAQEYLGIAYYLLQFKHLHYPWIKNIPVVITMHSPSFLYMEYNHVQQYKYPNYWICEMERFCLQAANLIISPSQFMVRELAERFHLTNDNLVIIPNPYEIQDVVLPETEGDQPSEIIFFGKLTFQKGASKLLMYFKEMWDNGFNEPLFLVGGQDIVYHPEGKTMGDLIRNKYKTYIEKGLLRLEDRISPSQIKSRLAAAKVVIVPSLNDNLPYVVFEMMGLGKVVLASKQGGHFEVIEPGKDGFIFDHYSPETFALQLKTILALSKEQRIAISENAIQKVKEKYSLKAIYGRKLAVLQNLLNQKGESQTFPFIRKSASGSIPLGTPDKEEVEGLLSIVIPYYNLGAYLDETVTSVLNSTYGQKEIIIVNDGSTDPLSKSILEKYRTKLGFVVLDKPNQGLASARNAGALYAKGAFLAFLDADDKVAPEYYTKAINVLENKDNVHFVGAWTQYFEGAKAIWPTFVPEPPVILFHNVVNSSALVYKRQSFLKGGLNDGKMPFQGLEDYDSVLSLVNKGLYGVVLPEPLFHYRVRKSSMIRSISANKKLLLYEYITTKYPEVYGAFAADVFNLSLANKSVTVLDNPSQDQNLLEGLPVGGKLSAKAISLIKRNSFVKPIAYKLYSTFFKK
ncbi:glycosyltransferase [Rufibacter latericius]|uniref:Glycosyltransferase n=2 Tax=Rufibacter latericius TaxID=2487040 RepID=A0A3M9MVT0_9BACT|nr:glycosyltransferase [Rufibacter latericius]